MQTLPVWDKRFFSSIGKLECSYGSKPGADLGFSRGGGADFQKIFQNFDDLFFFLGRLN